MDVWTALLSNQTVCGLIKTSTITLTSAKKKAIYDRNKTYKQSNYKPIKQ